MLAACSPDPVSPATDDPTSASPTAATTYPPTTEPSVSPSPPHTAPSTTLIAAESDFGAVLCDATGHAIELLDVETTSEPLCDESCADA